MTRDWTPAVSDDIADEIIANVAVITEDRDWLHDLLVRAATAGAFRYRDSLPPGARWPKIAEGLLQTVIPAPAGWRVVVLERESDGPAACPIVAWAIADAQRMILEPIAVIPSSDGHQVELNAGDPERVLGILAPGEEFEPYWNEVAEELSKAIREQQDREHAARAEVPGV